MPRKKTSKVDWPQVIYVKREEDGPTRYFVCSDHLDDLGFEAGETTTLARYVLLDTVTADASITISENR